VPDKSLPLAQVARILGVDVEALERLVADREEQGDPTLVALTVEEAARRIGIGRTKMYEYVSSGAVHSVLIGRLRRIPAEALDEFLAKRRGSDDFTTAA